LTLAQIAAQLTAEGMRTKQGRPWRKSTAAYVLKTHGRSEGT
jgi:Recombinase